MTGRNLLKITSRLPRLHEILMRGPNASRMEVQPSYWAVMCAATAKPPAEDAPGVIVNNARRAKDNAGGNIHAARGGF